MTHLSDDKTVAKMGHPIVVVRSDVGHPSRYPSGTTTRKAKADPPPAAKDDN